jgi:phosphatidylserine/phosphatidylglycerophosphate/cardiolipin synthase-like enzyme
MRKSSGPTPINGVRVKAYGGTTGVLVAMDVTDQARKGLLGFAIEREIMSGQFAGKKKWLEGMLTFPGLPHEPGQPVASNVGPIQKFRWSDYTVFPGTSYRYTVHAAYGPAGALTLKQGPQVDVTTCGPNSSHFVIFNRAAAASQAFARQFPKTAIELFVAKQKKKKLQTVKLPPEAYQWLSRGLLETIESVLARATDNTWTVDVCIYEYELDKIREAVAQAAQRVSKLRILYHAKPKDAQTHENKESLKTPPLPANVDTMPRKTSKIMHNKFIVLSKLVNGARAAQFVLCGSTNFTENGVYRQANVVHVTDDKKIAGDYLRHFEDLWNTADDPSETKKAINQKNPIVGNVPLFAGFSPRSGLGDLTEFVDVIQGAQRDVLFCTVFKLFDAVLKALKGKNNDPILRIGLQNTRTTITGFHKDRSQGFAAAAFLKEGLDGWLQEWTAKQKGNILVHTKIVVVDFTSNSPTIISGSHNLSKPASDGNDENYLIIRCDPTNIDIADSYGIELMRLYDHYRFRWLLQKSAKKKEPPALALDDKWTKDYFGGDKLKTADRQRFI